VSEIIQSQIQEWRRKSADGTLTTEELRAALAAIRKERVEASTTSTAARAKRTTAKEKLAAIDSDKLLNEFF
jgi:FMN-dependent NADH-azoreductase